MPPGHRLADLGAASDGRDDERLLRHITIHDYAREGE